MKCEICDYDEQYCSTIKAILNTCPEVECDNCGWHGDFDDLEVGGGHEHCPDCGSDEVYDFEKENDTLAKQHYIFEQVAASNSARRNQDEITSNSNS